jgi:hypothetical protein
VTDIVERLRHKRAVVVDDNTLCDEAADEIERLHERGDEAHAIVADQMKTISGQLDEIERLRGKVQQYETVIIPSWKREEADWIAENDRLRKDLEMSEHNGDVWCERASKAETDNERLRGLLLAMFDGLEFQNPTFWLAQSPDCLNVVCASVANQARQALAGAAVQPEPQGAGNE